MILNINILCINLMFRIIYEYYNILIIDINDILITDIIIDFSEKLKKLNLFLENIKKNHVF